MNEIKAIERELRIYESLKSRAINAFDKGNYEQSLDYIYLSATWAWTHPFGIWYDDKLEYLLSKVGKCVISSEMCNYERQFNKEREEHKKVVYIASHLHDVGGHSRVINEWVDMLSGTFREQCVYITNVMNTPTVSPYIINCLKQKGVRIVQLPWYDSYVNRIKEIAYWIKKDSPDIILLFIHPNDIIALSAVLSFDNRPYTVLFNHADHVFWLGRNAIDLF
ncbi:hypothetical protein [Acetomicrobium sp.]|uniref:hypothetical protein n=1 Tax=Acetomicrobium sp. TaxID=1872099 RepID=UPI002871288B|nr:hypothetical protein [Acetomicrobium sp.]MDR9768893.1 hypothetical protein [Acetomicrobium sp.]